MFALVPIFSIIAKYGYCLVGERKHNKLSPCLLITQLTSIRTQHLLLFLRNVPCTKIKSYNLPFIFPTVTVHQRNQHLHHPKMVHKQLRQIHRPHTIVRIMAKETIQIITAAVNTIVQHMAAMAIIIINGSSNMVQQLIAVAMDNGMPMPADMEIVVGTIEEEKTLIKPINIAGRATQINTNILYIILTRK